MLWYFRYDSCFQLFFSNHLKHLHLKISCWTACLQVRKIWNFMLHGPMGRLSFRASAEQCFPSVRKVQLKWVFPEVSSQKMKKCRIKLFLEVYIYTLYGDVYFVYFIYTYIFSVVLELILSLFWITHRQGALYSCLSLGPTSNRIQAGWHILVPSGCDLTTSNVLVCVLPCECPGRTAVSAVFVSVHMVYWVSRQLKQSSLCGLWLITTIGWEHGTAQAADGHLIWSRRNQKSLVSSVQSLSSVWLCDSMDCSMPGFPVLQQLPKLTQTHIHPVMPSNHLILYRPLLLLPSIFPSIRVFSKESALRIR